MPPAAAPSTPQNRVLPPKDRKAFTELLAQYEARQLTKGRKTADQILKKFPDHGETLCMKGLILVHLGSREEGVELVKKGMKKDLQSHICWHVFALIQKGERNYEEALKSYTQALRFDKDNANILRDAALLQTHLRYFDGLVESRLAILKQRPHVRHNWVALAVAHHLNGDLVEAKKVLEGYERSLKNVPDYDVEYSELLLYHIRILEELGEATEALALLDVNAKSRAIVDRTAIMEYRARLLSSLKSADAMNAWRALIEHNPDCYSYYRGFLSNQEIDLDSITEENRPQALEILRSFSAQLPKANAPRRLALVVATGDEFMALVKQYLSAALVKGIPSLFSDLKSLYRDPQKQKIIEETAEELRERYAAERRPDSSKKSEEPTTYLWTLYYLAQHHSYLSRHSQALSTLEAAIKHTPTLPELYMCKARALKRAGDLYGAAKAMNEARALDGQDRFVNTKCGKYRLRAGLVDEANEVFGMFTKKDAPSPGADLEDMQSWQYLIEEGDAQQRNGKPNLALKKYYAVERIFDQYEEDQYDFHGYSLRKSTLNVYIDLLKWEDQARSHPAFVHAAVAAARIWVALYDDPSIATKIQSEGSPSDTDKKAKKKAKKAAHKDKDQEDSNKKGATGPEDKGLEVPTPKDDDPEGIKLVAVTDPLERAAKLLQRVAGLVPHDVNVCFAVYDVAIRRKKYLQAVQALTRARSVDPEHPGLHIRIVDLRKAVSSLPEPVPSPSGPVLAEALSAILSEEVSLETYNSQYLQQHSTSAAAILASARVSRKLESPRDEVESLLFTALGAEVELSIETALEIISFLREIQSPRVDEFRAACDARFELSTVFKTRDQLAILRKECGGSGDEIEESDKVEVVG
ncbi:N-terminal acetyltransferase A, auxiliary subunit [Leucogyrophana mollusca]|uniref:N-terminal acetyltransferase A, auxiliary subunit n=1 Tax=Leucogyrophana mollusca TaxID=85980 RepID=A0ACB8BL87_9AGAM|nr:N-terminal acetyltransferase A, auxiliary subunit [Leucogyrophana mollusca]